jgi:xanthine dehydrogenase accessory factor
MAVIRVDAVEGSTPREAGCFMLVSSDATSGTIGGGRLELDAIAAARQLLAEGRQQERRDVALGPEINQCCGGRVVLEIARLGDDDKAGLIAHGAAEEARLAAILVFGAGHVGRALASALAPLPFNVTLIDSRADALLPPIDGIECRQLALPETLVRSAPAGSAVVVLTHDHAQDFTIVEEALRRDDLAYVGLIGSKTKRAVFRSQFLAEGGDAARFQRLVCPIGNNPFGDKRPEIIAAFVVAELLQHLLPSRTAGEHRARHGLRAGPSTATPEAMTEGRSQHD